MPNYSLLPAAASDAEALIACADNAYANDPYTQAVFPRDRQHLTSPEEFHDWKLSSVATRLSASNVGYVKAVSTDSPDIILGFAGYYLPGHFSSHSSAGIITPSLSNANKQSVVTPNLPACMDLRIQASLLEQLDRQREKIWGVDSQFWYLSALAVDPRDSGQGIGMALVDAVVQKAHDDGLLLYTEATPDGARLYEKMGFTEGGSFSLLGGSYVVKCMVKRPSPRR